MIKKTSFSVPVLDDTEDFRARNGNYGSDEYLEKSTTTLRQEQEQKNRQWINFLDEQFDLSPE